MNRYHCNTSSFRQFLGFLKRELRESIQLTIRSDGDSSIQCAVKQFFPNRIHLHCPRNTKKEYQVTFTEDITDTTRQMKTYEFSVQFTGVTYSGRTSVW